MRESEEYLEDETYDSWYTEENQKIVHKLDSEHAVKLAYKEGYLEALENTKKLIDDIFGNYVPWEIIEFEVKFNKLKDNVKDLS